MLLSLLELIVTRLHYDILKNGAPDYWVLEDGFQHLKLKRDFDIVLLDDEYPLSKRNLCLPSGRLREGMRAIQRANFVLFTRDKQTENVSLKKKLEKWKIPYSLSNLI